MVSVEAFRSTCKYRRNLAIAVCMTHPARRGRD
jgi:hypothetical protein